MTTSQPKRQKQPKVKEAGSPLIKELVDLANSVPDHELAKIPHDRSITYRQRLYGSSTES